MLAVGQGQVYALGQQTLYAFDAQTGKAVWKQAVGTAILYPGIDAHTKSLYLVDESSLRQPTATPLFRNLVSRRRSNRPRWARR